MATPQLSEQRARTAARELLGIRGWDLRPISSGGQLLEEAEYRYYPPLSHIFEGKSKTGPGIGKPDFLLVNSANSLIPLLVIDTKPKSDDLEKSIRDTNHYGNACYDAGHHVLSTAVAGAEKEICEVRCQKRVNGDWDYLTLHQRPINWIPSPQQTQKILADRKRTEVEPDRPSEEKLAEQANRLNEIFRECDIKDEFRPIHAATFMLALWFGKVSTDPGVVLIQINANARGALEKAGKGDLSESLRVDAKNEKLADKAWQIVDILENLGLPSFTQEHDYLGQLYETFFRYTGGNTIGQYFTPRHIINMMCELVQIGPKDIVFDPACGTGGFLIGALNRMIKMHGLPYKEAISVVRKNLFGMESEPSTAALCVTNMILRGDGTTGILQKDCFKNTSYPDRPVDCSLLNPPFPHGKDDPPATKFIDRALSSVRHKGIVSGIVPYSLLVNTKEWHRSILKNNKLLFVATMPGDLFAPYSSFNTAVVILQKGIPHEESNVFVCRLFNDGYKLKKKTRVRKPGTEIPKLLKAYDSKKEYEEFSAYARITQKSKEWSPEAFISGKPHKDQEFIEGFEQSVRNQAAFYVSNGHKMLNKEISGGIEQPGGEFSHNTSISFSDVNFGLFKVADYFSVVLGGNDEIEDLDDGNVPFVSTSEFENGVTTWSKPNEIYPPPPQ